MWSNDAMVEPPASLPPGLTCRSATVSDVDLVTDMVRAAEMHDLGEVLLTREDVEADFVDPDRDIAADTLLVFDRDELVGYVEVPNWRADGEVHPSHRSRGIGTALVDWMELRCLARTPADTDARVGQTQSDTLDGAVTLFRSRGYEVRHTSWILRLPRRTVIGERQTDGIEIRSFADADGPEVHRVIEDAFNEWPNRTLTSYGSWRAHSVERADFDPELLLVAVDTAGSIVGCCYGIDTPEEGWVDQVAVRRDRRGQGIAQALLARSFGTFRHRGHTQMGLSTDSRTGALDLYLKLGMTVESTFHHWSKLLRPAATPDETERSK